MAISIWRRKYENLDAASQKYPKSPAYSGAPAGGGRFPPPETGKIVVEKWCYFPELYKITEVLEDGIENG